MASYRSPLTGAFLVTCLISAFHSVFMSAPGRLRMKTYPEYPQDGSSEPGEFQCTGNILNEQEAEFFTNGGRLVWLADGETIAYTNVLEHLDDFVVDHDKYSIDVHNLSTNHDELDYMVILRVNNISVSDSKKYRCALVSNQHVTVAESRETSYNVQYAPDLELYPQCNIDRIPKIPNMVTLKCRSQTAYPNVDLNWMSRGLVVGRTSESDGFTESKLNVSIPITNTEYECVLNYVGNYEQKNSTCKIYPPKVLLNQDGDEVVEGGDAVFTCSVTAKPPSNSEQGIKWSFVPSLKSRITTTSQDSSFSRLTISNVTADDNGTEIICLSRNLLGEKFKRAILIVKTFKSSIGTYIPPFKVDVVPPIAQVLPGKIATFQCQVSTYKDTYEYKWYYNGEEIDSESMSEKIVIEPTLQRLRVLSVDADDNNATVACVVMAPNGDEKIARARVLVIQPPQEISPGESSKTDSSDDKTDVWNLVIPISAGLISLSLIMLLIWKATKRCSDKKDRGHTITDSVAYLTPAALGPSSFNNSPRLSNFPSSSRATTKTVNHDRLMVNLPPVPPIPTEDEEQELDALRCANKLGEFEDYQDMDTARSNYYHQHENDENNQYQHVIDRLEKGSNHQENAIDFPEGIQGIEPLY